MVINIPLIAYARTVRGKPISQYQSGLLRSGNGNPTPRTSLKPAKVLTGND